MNSRHNISIEQTNRTVAQSIQILHTTLIRYKYKVKVAHLFRDLRPLLLTHVCCEGIEGHLRPVEVGLWCFVFSQVFLRQRHFYGLQQFQEIILGPHWKQKDTKIINMSAKLQKLAIISSRMSKSMSNYPSPEKRNPYNVYSYSD